MMTGTQLPPVVLASASPQRRELLGRLGIPFAVSGPEVEEVTHGEPREVVLANALLKARSIAEPGNLTIGCDTEVVLGGRLLGKPEDALRAHEYVAQLSGRRHLVLSGLAVIGPEPDDVRTGIAETEVVFRELTREGVDAYVASGEWEGRAGGYAIQGAGSAMVDSIEGDLSNVIGLPVPLLADLAPELRIPAGTDVPEPRGAG